MAAESEQARGLLVSGRFADLEDALVTRVGEIRAGRPLAPVTIVVGSAALSTRLGDLLVRRLGAVAGVSVLTLARLATDVVARATAEGSPRVANAAVRERLVRRVVAERRDGPGLRYFAPVSAQPHFAQALAATFDDLRQARVGPRPGWVQTATPAKAADMEALYAAYCAALEQRGLRDDAELHVAAAAAVRAGVAGSGARTFAHTIVYGLYDLNAAQEKLVAALLETGADVFLPVSRAGGTESAPARRLARHAGLTERPVEPPPPANDLARAAAALGAPRVSGEPSLELDGDGSLRVISVSDERGEVREAVREVLAAASAAGDTARFWDCAIVVPHAGDVRRFAAGLAAAGLPVACRLPDPSLGERVVSRLLDCLAPAAGKPFARRAVLDLLMTAAALPSRVAGDGEFVPAVPAPEVARWADEARRAGVGAGLGQWAERLSRGRYGLERRLQELGAGSESAMGDDGTEKRESLELRLAAARSLEHAIGDLASACARIPETASWAKWAESLAALVNHGFPSVDGAGACDAVSRLHVLDAVDELVDLREMAAVLRQQLATATVAEGRVYRDGVAILTPLDLRGLRFHTVVFAGLAEGGFPARGRPDPIYGDAERARTAAALGVRLPLAEEREAESALLFALALEASRARLSLLAPRNEAATGRPRLPSRLLLRVASLAAGRAVGIDDLLSGAPLKPVWRHISGRGSGAAASGTLWVDQRERDIAVLVETSAANETAAAEYLGAVLAESAGPAAAEGARAARRRLAQWRSGRSEVAGGYDGVLGSAARQILISRDLFAAELHPTRLERYLDCPFAYLLRDVLGLSVPEEPADEIEMDAREFGTLAHEILKRVYGEVIAEGMDRDGALAAVEGPWQAACDEARRRGLTGSDMAWNARRQALREDLLETVRGDPVFKAQGERPALVEWGFGEAEDRPVALDLPGGRRVRFAGRVDRVDATPRGARVVDYKTGAGGPRRSASKPG